MSLKKITGSENGPAENHPAPALTDDFPLSDLSPVTEMSVRA